MKFFLKLTIDHAIEDDAELRSQYIADILKMVLSDVTRGGWAGEIKEDGKRVCTWGINK